MKGPWPLRPTRGPEVTKLFLFNSQFPKLKEWGHIFPSTALLQCNLFNDLLWVLWSMQAYRRGIHLRKSISLHCPMPRCASFSCRSNLRTGISSYPVASSNLLLAPPLNGFGSVHSCPLALSGLGTRTPHLSQITDIPSLLVLPAPNLLFTLKPERSCWNSVWSCHSTAYNSFLAVRCLHLDKECPLGSALCLFL